MNEAVQQGTIERPTAPTPRTKQVYLERPDDQEDGEQPREDDQTVVDYCGDEQIVATTHGPERRKSDRGVANNSDQRHRHSRVRHQGVLRVDGMRPGARPGRKSQNNPENSQNAGDQKVSLFHCSFPPAPKGHDVHTKTNTKLTKLQDLKVK